MIKSRYVAAVARTLALLLVVLLAAGPAQGQRSARPYRIGMLEVVPEAANLNNMGAFRRGLAELGYAEGRDFVIEYRFGDGQPATFARLASELVKAKVDVIVTRGTPAVLAAKGATGEIAIVMASSGDPVGAGVVQSLARPGGNVTGLSALAVDVQGKLLDLVREVVPGVHRVAFVFNMGNAVLQAEWREVEPKARAMGLEPQLLDVRSADQLELAIDAAVRQHADAVIVGVDALLQANRARIANALASHQLPAISREREFAEAGGLMSYGVPYAESYHRAASYVDKILRGARPADLPIEQATRIELVVNLKAAQALGLRVPATIRLQADRVIE